MATLTNTRAATTFPVFQGFGGGQVCAAYGSYTFAVNPTAADIVELCRLPAGAVVLGGWFRGEDIDTGTETLDIDIGWPANGGTGTSDSADPDGFGNFGLLSGDAVTDVKPEVSILYTLNGTLKSGPVTFTKETLIQAVVNTAANAGGTGVIWVCIFYIVP
jgi:hypothetical protein